ncbi:LysR family transcriptional regulator [Variovorax sp. dw_308]|uniref:LysR family transcriptional regulator n=1 Tax=Variovorax sp. dw_308 TaxID=2721546 RepID=UPI001C4506BE|nr:LysR family transcriptional regulator [Variovorax sp. dw_308]
MDINLRDLKYFETVAELGHLGQAADKLGRTQPALTKCVQRLEEAFGSALFERKGRGIQLTPVGEVLLMRARLLRSATEEALREVGDFARGNAGHVRIGSGPIAADHVLPEICSLLLAEAPGTTIDITIAPSMALRERLREGTIDLLIGLMSEHDDAFVTHSIVEDVVVVATSPSHPVFDLPKVTMNALLQWNWVLPDQATPSRQWLDAVFQSHGLAKPTVQINANSIPLLPRLIARTDLLSFLSRHTLGTGDRRNALREVPLKETTLRRKLGVTYRKEGYLSPAAQRLVTLLRSRGERLFTSAMATGSE